MADLHCPSAQPDMQGARPFGLATFTAQETRIVFLKKDAAEALDWRAHLSEAEATRVLRFGAQCETTHCAHYDGAHCGLGQRVAASLPGVVSRPPPCLLRPRCRWHVEQGDAVCLRCPQVISSVPPGDAELGHLATVPATAASQHV